MNSKDCFDTAFLRAEHFLTLYHLLHDTRARRIRSDWAAKFKELMHWPARDEIVRIDGKDKNSILIFKQDLGIDREQFSHDFLSELLRSSLVAVVSALDMYLHDLVVSQSWKLLSQKENDIPSELKRIRLPIVETKRALERARNSKSRPGYLVKQAIQTHLHRDFTFQNPESVVRACKMLGVKNFWERVTVKMPGNLEKKDVISKLDKVSRRRNQIVHEADLIPKLKYKKITLRNITLRETEDWVYWIRDLVIATDEVVKDSF